MQPFQPSDILRVTRGPLKGQLVVVLDGRDQDPLTREWMVKLKPIDSAHGDYFRFYHKDWVEPVEPVVAAVIAAAKTTQQT